MVEPIGVTSGLLGITIFTLKCAFLLRDLLGSIQSASGLFTNHLLELDAIVVVLNSLKVTIAEDEAALRTLEGPIAWCGQACSELHKQLEARAGNLTADGSRLSKLKEWLKLPSTKTHLDEFRTSLASYKATIGIAVGDVNLRRLRVSDKVVEEYMCLIRKTKADLEDHLRQIQQKLDSMDTSEPPASESHQLPTAEEIQRTKSCIKVCEDAAKHISRLQLEATTSQPGRPSDTKNAPPYGVSELADLLTMHSFERARNDFETTARQLEGTLGGISVCVYPQSVEQQFLATEAKGLSAQLRFLDGAESRGETYRENRSKDVAVADDALNIMVSTVDALLNVENLNIGARAVSFFGQASDESFQLFLRGVSQRHLEGGTRDSHGSSSFEARNGVGKSLGNR